MHLHVNRKNSRNGGPCEIRKVLNILILFFLIYHILTSEVSTSLGTVAILISHINRGFSIYDLGWRAVARFVVSVFLRIIGCCLFIQFNDFEIPISLSFSLRLTNFTPWNPYWFPLC